ncbi:MAG: DUF4907 domain-containing protein [Bacteroidia bacterium]|nr:DUF4907 domain-containing protein [Bacteroidia bacterium]
MKTFYLLLFLFCSIASFAQTDAPHKKPNNRKKPTSKEWASAYITYQIFVNPDSTFGYDIIQNGKRIVHQTVVPGRTTGSGFVSRTDAAKVARLATRKINVYPKQIPPAITDEELRQLHIR